MEFFGGTGITEIKKICALAQANHLQVVPHGNAAHNLHVIMSQPNCPLSEYFPDVEPDSGNELLWKVFKGEPVAQNGYLELSEEPGLGIQLNEENIRELIVEDL